MAERDGDAVAAEGAALLKSPPQGYDGKIVLALVRPPLSRSLGRGARLGSDVTNGGVELPRQPTLDASGGEVMIIRIDVGDSDVGVRPKVVFRIKVERWAATF